MNHAISLQAKKRQPAQNVTTSRKPLTRCLQIIAISSLALLCYSLFQIPIDPMMQKGYALFTISTSGLLALHHSLLH